MKKNNFLPLATNMNTFDLCFLGESFTSSGISCGFSVEAKGAVDGDGGKLLLPEREAESLS